MSSPCLVNCPDDPPTPPGGSPDYCFDQQYRHNMCKMHLMTLYQGLLEYEIFRENVSLVYEIKIRDQTSPWDWYVADRISLEQRKPILNADGWYYRTLTTKNPYKVYNIDTRNIGDMKIVSDYIEKRSKIALKNRTASHINALKEQFPFTYDNVVVDFFYEGINFRHGSDEPCKVQVGSALDFFWYTYRDLI
jgi:hypothetical protein